jgi:uncharacterized membrane protein (UPF0136 family)
METSQIYILIFVLVLAVISFFVRKGKKTKKFTPLTVLALGFILAGIVFGDTQFVSYILMGTGILLAVIDIILKLIKK